MKFFPLWGLLPLMDILLTADLHSKLTWFRWLESQAEKYELIGIAGDFLDLFSSVDPKTHQSQPQYFCGGFRAKRKLRFVLGIMTESTISRTLVLRLRFRYQSCTGFPKPPFATI